MSYQSRDGRGLWGGFPTTPVKPAPKPRTPSKPKPRKGALANFPEGTIFMVTESGYRSGFKVKPTRAVVGRAALVKHLRTLALADALNRGVIPYGVVVYAVSADAAPVKVDKEELQLQVLELGRAPGGQVAPTTRATSSLVPGVAPLGVAPATKSTPADPANYRMGRRMTYDELKKVPDGTVVWVSWSPPDASHGTPISGPHTVRRSGSKGSSRHPVWYLTDMVEKFEEIFVQSSALQWGGAPAQDEDKVELFFAAL